MRKALITAIVLIVLDAIATTAIWIGANGSMPRPQSLPAQAPLVVFYSSDSNGLSARVQAASNAYAAYGRRPVICVGGARPSRRFYGAEKTGRQLVARGVDPLDIMSERQSFRTEDNLTAAFDLAGNAPTIVLVSDTLHLIRIKHLAAFATSAPRILLYPTYSTTDPFEVWWRVHYEAVAWMSLVLPDHIRSVLVRWARL